MILGPSPQDAAADRGYPVQFEVEYSDRPLNRLTTAFRPFVAIPIVIVLANIGGQWAEWAGETRYLTVGGTFGGILFLPPLLMIVFRRKYPRWWFDFNLELQRFTNRVGAYLALMHDRYPSTDEKQYVTLEIPYPDAARDLNRWLPLVKWLLAIPHYVVLLFLWLAALLFAIAAWFAILFTGRFPRGMFDFIESVLRWTNRVEAYVLLLATDRYPPFRLSP
jgi:Domain of unknown function (DUF4389)